MTLSITYIGTCVPINLFIFLFLFKITRSLFVIQNHCSGCSPEHNWYCMLFRHVCACVCDKINSMTNNEPWNNCIKCCHVNENTQYKCTIKSDTIQLYLINYGYIMIDNIQVIQNIITLKKKIKEKKAY